MAILFGNGLNKSLAKHAIYDGYGTTSAMAHKSKDATVEKAKYTWGKGIFFKVLNVLLLSVPMLRAQRMEDLTFIREDTLPALEWRRVCSEIKDELSITMIIVSYKQIYGPEYERILADSICYSQRS